MRIRALLTICIGAALTAFAQYPADDAMSEPDNQVSTADFKTVEAPAPSDVSMPSAMSEAPAPSDENLDADAVEPVEPPIVEAGGKPYEAPVIANIEAETSPAVEAPAAPGSDTDETPYMP